jgi:primosomal protein N' (replication factor Y) (superfamily II helicase)
MSATPPSGPGVLRIALDTPLRRLFDYLPPEDLPLGAMPVGARVHLPFGRRQLVGTILAHAAGSELPVERLRRVAELIDAEPLLDDTLRGFLSWASEYYHHPIGEVVAAALPRLLREGAPALAALTHWSATAAGTAALAGAPLRRAPQQRALLQRLIATQGASSLDLAEGAPNWRGTLRKLSEQGFVVSHEEPVTLQDAAPLLRVQGLTLGSEQQAAFAAVRAGLGGFASFLLDGVTGSGKTEVYLRVIEEVLARGQRALVLVPEIGLTPQLLQRLHERFDTVIAPLHSQLTDRERLLAWRDARSGRARIVIGTRSAVFAPVPQLGVIIVDEEHDASFKQHEGGFRYSARDLAIVRAQQVGVPVLLGSATPALESLYNVAVGKATRLSLPRRAGAAATPTLALLDLRAHAQHRGLSAPLLLAMEKHLGDGNQVLIFINRRGYAPTLLCKACGWIAPCTHCDARLTVHRASDTLACHHCGAQQPLPTGCPRCGHELRPVGQGTERIEEVLRERFADVPLVRFDRDSVQKAADLEAALLRVNSGEARILVGTQMLTKGHHFPQVTLVGVLNADQSLFSADFRAAERLAQTIIQVAGRAGRAAKPGEVLIQTDYPQHPLLQNLLARGYDGFAQAALAERADARWPPYSRLALLRSSGKTAQAALAFLEQARAQAQPPMQVKLLGPVPASMARRAGRHHAQLLAESPDRAALHRFLADWLPQLDALPEARGVRWSLDVDPQEVF